MPLHLQILLPLFTLALGHGFGQVSYTGLAFGLVYAFWVLAAPKLPARLWFPVTLLASIAFAAHLVPGFSPLPLAEPLRLSPDAPPYALRLSWDKTLVGMALLGWWLGRTAPTIASRWRATAVTAAATLLAVPALALGLDLVDWMPKWPELVWRWLPVNLLAVVLAEELVFRGLLHGALVSRLGAWAGVGLTALLFGAVHLPFSPLFAAVATVAGLGYGLAFHFSGRLGVAMALHLAVNLCHLALLSYPVKLG